MTLFAEIEADPIKTPILPPEPTNLRDRFSAEMEEDDVLELVQKIAGEWAASYGDFEEARRVAELMPDPLGWFARNVKVPEFPKALVAEIETLLDQYMLNLPGDRECCGESPRRGWSYCPVCGDEYEEESVKSIFQPFVSDAIGARKYALTCLETTLKERNP